MAATPSPSPSALSLRRLAKDLHELQQHPLGFATAAPVTDNLLLWHATIRVASGPYANLPVHLALEFNVGSSVYPTDPPQVTLLTTIKHPNVIRGRICLDMLRKSLRTPTFDTIEVYQGWSSAYSVSTVLVQLTSFLMETDNIPQEIDYRQSHPTVPLVISKEELAEVVTNINAFVCPTPGCGFSTKPRPVAVEKAPASKPAAAKPTGPPPGFFGKPVAPPSPAKAGIPSPSVKPTPAPVQAQSPVSTPVVPATAPAPVIAEDEFPALPSAGPVKLVLPASLQPKPKPGSADPAKKGKRGAEDRKKGGKPTQTPPSAAAAAATTAPVPLVSAWGAKPPASATPTMAAASSTQQPASANKPASSTAPTPASPAVTAAPPKPQSEKEPKAEGKGKKNKEQQPAQPSAPVTTKPADRAPTATVSQPGPAAQPPIQQQQQPQSAVQQNTNNSNKSKKPVSAAPAPVSLATAAKTAPVAEPVAPVIDESAFPSLGGPKAVVAPVPKWGKPSVTTPTTGTTPTVNNSNSSTKQSLDAKSPPAPSNSKSPSAAEVVAGAAATKSNKEKEKKFAVPRRQQTAPTAWFWRVGDAVSSVFQFLDLDALNRCYHVCYGWRTVIENYALIHRLSLSCFYSKISWEEDIMGIGVRAILHRNLASVQYLASSFDVLSHTAFLECNVRRSVWNDPFDYFLPLYINPRHAGDVLHPGKTISGEERSVRAVFEQSCLDILNASRDPRVLSASHSGFHGGRASGMANVTRLTRFQPEMVLKVLPRLMTYLCLGFIREEELTLKERRKKSKKGKKGSATPRSAGVTPRDSHATPHGGQDPVATGAGAAATGAEKTEHEEDEDEDDEHKEDSRESAIFSGAHHSEKALEGYCFCHHLLLACTRWYPSIVTECDRVVDRFAESELQRTKRYTPNLGELIVCLNLSKKGWKEVGPLIVLEAFTRAVRWSLKPFPELENVGPKSTVSVADRLQKSLQSSITGKRLILFQHFFLKEVGHPTGKTLENMFQAYNKTFGYPQPGVVAKLQKACKEIRAVSTWQEFYRHLNLPYPGDDKLAHILEQAVVNSAKAGYHAPRGVSALGLHGTAHGHGHGSRKDRHTPRAGFTPRSGHGTPRDTPRERLESKTAVEADALSTTTTAATATTATTVTNGVTSPTNATSSAASVTSESSEATTGGASHKPVPPPFKPRDRFSGDKLPSQERRQPDEPMQWRRSDDAEPRQVPSGDRFAHFHRHGQKRDGERVNTLPAAFTSKRDRRQQRDRGDRERVGTLTRRDPLRQSVDSESSNGGTDQEPSGNNSPKHDAASPTNASS